MKKLIFVLVMAALLGGGAVATMSAPSQAQVYQYPPPPANIYGMPWVGQNTPWTFYNGDWFLNGILYYFFGPRYGWAPYYAYAPIYIVRAPEWYAPRWNAWYRGHPHYWEHFRRTYPYWHNHRPGHRYDRRFYEKHHRGQGPGWHKGFRGGGPPPPPPGGRGPGPGHVTHPPGPKPGPGHVGPPGGPKAGPGHAGPPASKKPVKAAPGPHKHEKGKPGEEKH
jgi:hypothetical protein